MAIAEDITDVTITSEQWSAIEGAADPIGSGGTHGMYGYGGYSYDTKTGKCLTTEDIFADKDNLAEIISEKLISMYGADIFYNGEFLIEYINEYISNNSLNVVLTNMGPRVYFNPYEIASYADGAFIVDIDPKECLGLVNPVFEEKAESFIVKLDENIFLDINGDDISEGISYAEDLEYIYGEDYFYSKINGFNIYAGAEELYVPADGVYLMELFDGIVFAG